MNDEENAIKVENVSKTFHIPLEASNGLKQKLINTLKGRKGYREFTPLNDISFTINKGDFFGIVGRNGSGKSTLLKTIAGIYSPTKGGVHVNGSLIPFIELGVGFNPELTGKENVFLNGALLGFSRKEMEVMYNEIVDFAELHDFMEERLKNYSSGMQVRLAFSIAIRADGDILLLDEVLAVGDSSFQQKCFDYFEELKKNNKTIILVTHDMSAVKRFCSKAVLIKDGRVENIGTPEDVANQYLFDNLEVSKESIEVVAEEADDEDSHYKTKEIKKLSVAPISPSKLTHDDVFKFDIKYQLNEDMRVYLGFSIMYQGVSIMEENSRNIALPGTAGRVHTVSYELPLRSFNTTPLKINVSIFGYDNRETLGYVVDACEFLVTRNDETRGGPIATGGSWSL